MIPIPKISVLMLLFNRPTYMRMAIDSVLQQSFTEFELILLDNGSHDSKVYEAAQEYQRKDKRIKALREPIALGLSKGRDKILKHANCKIVATIEDDDFWHPEKLAKQWELIQSRADLAAVYVSYQIIDKDNKPIGRWNLPNEIFESTQTLEGLDLVQNFPGSGQMFRLDMVKRAGAWREFFNNADDTDLFYRLQEQSCVASIAEKLLYYRMWSSGTSQNPESTIYANAAKVSAICRRSAGYDPIDEIKEKGREAAAKVYFDFLPPHAKKLSGKQLYIITRSFCKSCLLLNEKAMLERSLAMSRSFTLPTRYRFLIVLYLVHAVFQHKKWYGFKVLKDHLFASMMTS